MAFPLVASSYLLSLATLALYLAYVGQAWNVMMGFAGQLSLGHSLYVGLGAYVAAGLFQHFGVGPWAGVWLAVVSCAAIGVIIGLLAFRLGISGVQLSLLTVAFAELARIAFDHLDWFGGPGGLFLQGVASGPRRPAGVSRPARGCTTTRFWPWRRARWGSAPCCCAAAPATTGAPSARTRAAAQALGIDTFRWKMLAVVLSSAMTGVAGVFFAFYNNSLFPEQIFGFGRSIEIILGPVIGGLGTLFGPIVGAVALVVLGDGTTEILARLGSTVPGARQVVHGVLLLRSPSTCRTESGRRWRGPWISRPRN